MAVTPVSQAKQHAFVRTLATRPTTITQETTPVAQAFLNQRILVNSANHARKENTKTVPVDINVTSLRAAIFP